MRTTTTAQDTALSALDRTTHVRVKIDDADGTAQDVSSLQGEDFLDQVIIDVQTEAPISTATITLFREIGDHSISPLRTDSLINRDSAGAYAQFLAPFRDVTIEVATMLAGETPVEADYVMLWEGIVDEVDWGGSGKTCVVHARDPMARLNDTLIETVAEYGDAAGSKDVEDVIQDILTAEISSPAVTLAFTATSFPVDKYDLGNVTVLDACQALTDLIGWNLHWRWNTSASAFRLTLWEPDRSQVTADLTLGPDDYYVIPSVGQNLEGIRNKGEVVYLTTAGTTGTATETRTESQTLYSTRFIRVDARETSLATATQASDLLSAILDDLEEPAVQQQIETAFWWPLELGDVVGYTANDHYDNEQRLAVFGYRHILSNNGPRRTMIVGSGKPSGGFERWHNSETGGRPARPGGPVRPGGPAVPGGPRRAPSVSVTFDASGQAIVSATGPASTANMYVTVGDGTDPADPTATTNDGTITGRSGTVSTTKKVTTGNEAYVRVIAVDYEGTASTVAAVRHARRLGQFHKDATTRSHTGDTNRTVLETITVPANALGLDGGVKVEAWFRTVASSGNSWVGFDLNGTSVVLFLIDTAANDPYVYLTLTLFNKASASAQGIGYTFVADPVSGLTTVQDVGYTNKTEDTTSALDIELVGQLANSGDTAYLYISHAQYVGTD